MAVRFDDALGATTGRFAAAARNLAASVALNLGMIKLELTGPARLRPDPTVAFHAILGVLIGTAQRHPTILVVDEFSSIGRISGAAGALRTALQHHYTDLSIIIAGSHPSMMRNLFSARPEPFYGQADLVEIGPLSSQAVEEIVGSGFAETGRDAAHVAGQITTFTTGHPQRAMQLADACWRHTPAGATATAGIWAEALSDVRRATGKGWNVSTRDSNAASETCSELCPAPAASTARRPTCLICRPGPPPTPGGHCSTVGTSSKPPLG